MARQKLKAPFPAFGGKSQIAGVVWERLGNVTNYIEPFLNSGAVLLLRPHAPKVETVNDLDCYIANFWRATQNDPDAVAAHADGPVNEVDLHSRHRWLVLSDDADAFRSRMRTDPDYFDPKIAGWWCWGLCCWIGTGWCVAPDNPVNGPAGGTGERSVILGGGKNQQGHGIHAKGPALSSQVPAGQRTLTGVHAKRPCMDNGRGVDPAAVPELPQQLPLIGDPPRGGHRGAELSQQLPMMSAAGRGLDAAADVHEKIPNIDSRGVPSTPREGLSEQLPKLSGYASGCVPEDSGTHVRDGGRPQLADTYSRGRGVHGHDEAGTCDQRRAWLTDWFRRLRDRFRTVRVCCGDWLRVCDSDSVTTRLGTTGVFFDPPYGEDAGRNMNIYSHDSGTVAADVRRYCLERGPDPSMRIVLAGYAGEGHESLEAAGWDVLHWKAQGGYGNVGKKKTGNANARKERLWVSPHCLKSGDLYDLLD